MIYMKENTKQWYLSNYKLFFKKILINPYYLLLNRYSILSFTKFQNIGHQNLNKTMHCCKVQNQKQKPQQNKIIHKYKFLSKKIWIYHKRGDLQNKKQNIDEWWKKTITKLTLNILRHKPSSLKNSKSTKIHNKRR